MEKEKSSGTIHLTFKAIALWAADEAGLIPKTKDGKIDISRFDRFWDIFFPELKEAENFPDVKKLFGTKESRSRVNSFQSD